MNKLNSIQNGNSSLKACPFCGGETKLSAPNMHGISNVICPKCGMTGSYGNEETITAAWNRRTQPENKPMTIADFDNICFEPIYIIPLGKAIGEWSGHWCIFQIDSATANSDTVKGRLWQNMACL